MSRFRLPGTLGCQAQWSPLDTGTLALHRSAMPGLGEFTFGAYGSCAPPHLAYLLAADSFAAAPIVKRYRLNTGAIVTAALEVKIGKIADAYFAATQSTLTINSGTRTARSQADAMYIRNVSTISQHSVAFFLTNNFRQLDFDGRRATFERTSGAQQLRCG
jgi:hypothetical protein